MHGTERNPGCVQIPQRLVLQLFCSKENFAAETIQHYINPFIAQLSVIYKIQTMMLLVLYCFISMN